ncbi:unnamed protein product [Arctia plantaginis]|uniref:THAP-type domain-containing protein n=1 Tax=Arctia plantaginis TaxID=874455 RepID=A0A8S0Z023_ARCPL|nr:unnamed protein product [Arctia plantaginis]
MPWCVLRYCSNNSRNTAKCKGITLHRNDKREKWIKFVQNNRCEETWLPSDHSYICSLHFREDDKYITKGGRHFLKKSAVPYDDQEVSAHGAIESISEPVSESKSIFDSPRKIILKRQIRNLTSAKKRITDKFTVLRKFALTLHYYSPAAYKYVRDIYGNMLPHTRTLSRWYGTIDGEPGFTNASFEALKKKNTKSQQPLICNLVFDEMAIRRQMLFHKHRKLGAVNFGAGPQVGDEDDQVASQALVFMLVSLTENWKLPVGYFLISGITAETKANLITTCLHKCHDAGVTVVSMTFDGCPANLSAAEILGCKLTNPNSFVTHFPHPSTQDKVCIFLDPCHVIKLIRNSFENKRLLFDQNGKKIKWQLLINLNKLQMKDGLRFANKLTPRHVYFRNQIMKVRLATQLLSKSVAKALQLCDEELKYSQFADSSATILFLETFNDFFDTMNSRKCYFYGFKRPIDAINNSEVFSFLTKIKKYILNLEFHIKCRRIVKRKDLDPRITLSISKKKIVDSANKTGFIGPLICTESLKTLYQHVVEEKKYMTYISTYRLSQDHIELFFGVIRKHGEYNNNPNVLQFRAAYKKTLNHLELRSSFTGNCIPLDNMNILCNSSTDVINSTTPLNRHDNEEYEVLTATSCLESDIEAEHNCNIFSDTLSSQQIPFGSQLIVGAAAN